MNRLNVITMGLLVAIIFPCAGQESAKKDHATMRKERALAGLAMLQARILEHEAELQELAEHARAHERHIHDHDGEIEEHEKGGSGTDHEKLAKHHKKLMQQHARKPAGVEKNSLSHNVATQPFAPATQAGRGRNFELLNDQCPNDSSSKFSMFLS